jgi:hypothetical protein
VNVTLWREESVAGKLNPLMEKLVPPTFASEMVTADPPLLVNVSERLELSPFCTFPKESAEDDAARAEPAWEPPVATPWQPLSRAIPLAIRRELIKQRRDRKTRNGPIP